jgi:hypothetical protein
MVNATKSQNTDARRYTVARSEGLEERCRSKKKRKLRPSAAASGVVRDAKKSHGSDEGRSSRIESCNTSQRMSPTA